MALNASPRKVVPLSTGDDWDSSSGPSLTRSVFFCGVVVETYGSSKTPDDVQDFLEYLGENMSGEMDTAISPRSSPASRGRSDSASPTTRPVVRKRALTNTSALHDVIAELVATEKSYVGRLQALKDQYADPLRTFAKSKDTLIIPPYHAKTLFGNIDQLLPVNKAFLADLQDMVANGHETGIGVGDVALKHFRDLHGFEQYKQYYSKREEAQNIFETEMKRHRSQFAQYIDRIKYTSATDVRNRIGLRELLMDPVQRIPRYTLLFRNMIKFMAPGDPQRAKLEEADAIASKIALAETDEQTKRAAILHSLSMSIDSFPAGLVSSGRRFIDCIDVEEASSLSHGRGWSEDNISGGKDTLHCTLILFDDKLMIVKRPDGEKGGRALAGIDDVDKVAKGLFYKKKSGLVFKGVVPVSDVVATDVGGSDLHMFFEEIPQDWPERWAGRPFRAFTAVDPSRPPNLNPGHTESAKLRFLENLWETQARCRTRRGQSMAMRGEEFEVEAKGEKVTRARAYYNVYHRAGFLMEEKKTKIVLHVDVRGTADPIPFGADGGSPLVVIRLQPIEGELCRYSVFAREPEQDDGEDIVQSARVPYRIVQTIHQYGLFKFRTGANSIPGTPTATQRSRVAIFGLDAISRGLFNVRPGTKTSEIFGAGHRRGKSATGNANGTVLSRTSTTTITASTGESSMTKSHCSNFTATTAPTSVSSGEDDACMPDKPTRRSRKLTKGGKSRDGDHDRPSSLLSRSLSRSRSRSSERQSDEPVEYSDPEEDIESFTCQQKPRGDSEWNLQARLELARQNTSQNQSTAQLDGFDAPVEDSIYEQDPPPPFRLLSRASRDMQSARSTTPTLRPESPISIHTPHSQSAMTPERRPGGPRSASLLEPSPLSSTLELPEGEGDLTVFEDMVVNTPQALATPARSSGRTSPLPRSRRMPFDPLINLAIPGPSKPAVEESPKSPRTEPLLIKKKTSVLAPSIKTSPPGIPRLAASIVSTSTTPQAEPVPSVSPPRTRTIRRGPRYEDTERLSHLAKTTKEDLESSHRAVKKLKVEVTKRPAPSRLPYFSGNPEAEKQRKERMEEVRKSIALRNVADGFARNRARSLVDAAGPPPRQPEKSSPSGDVPDPVDVLLSDLEKYLELAMTKQDDFCEQFGKLKLNIDEDATELERTRLERHASRRKNEVLQVLFEDTLREKDVMYEQFNDELDLLSNSLAPAAAAMGYPELEDTIREIIEERKRMDRENSYVGMLPELSADTSSKN
ncbi:hypothetical protein NEOLEDRAFT_1175007 [Neolentinus lepideus HHB14362 ss-1]|uniref:DH domain-containing protein n=1 Tax=Neolentinus lepideus HHB14362 ss-1 TaxID=1314782 RepID=A0A165V7X7_9AGAM|nr:hypothetical protein NEOLEDRAFT_1175007 [Neolentinus lepideus HHB14362 ss-1]